MSTACASRKRALGRERVALGVGEARERLGADDPAAGQVDDRLEGDVEAAAVDQRLHARLDPLAALLVERDPLLRGPRALALGHQVLGQLVLELAQLLGDRDEADQQADGGDRELAGAQRQARPPRAGEQLGRPHERERVEPRQDHHRQHAQVGPGHRAAGAPPPEGGDAGLRDHDEPDQRTHRGGEPVAGREVAQRWRGNGGPGEEEGTQAAEDQKVSQAWRRDRPGRRRPRRSGRGARSGSARRRRPRSAAPARHSGNRLGSATSVVMSPIIASVVPTESHARR